MTDQVEGQMSIYDLDGWSGKMSQEHFHRPEKESQKAPTSKPSSRKSSGSSDRTLPKFLYLTTGSGTNRAAYSESVPTGFRFPSVGDFTMRSFGEQPSTLMAECGFPGLPNGVSESHLSQILQDAEPRYYLSHKACLGILNRAKRKGRELPEMLKQALEKQAGL